MSSAPRYVPSKWAMSAGICVACLAAQGSLVWLLWRSGESYICSNCQPFQRVDRTLSLYLTVLYTASSFATVLYPFIVRYVWRRMARRDASQAQPPRRWPRALFWAIAGTLLLHVCLSPFLSPVGVPSDARDRIREVLDSACVGNTAVLRRTERPLPFTGNRFVGESLSTVLPPGAVVVDQLGRPGVVGELRIVSLRPCLPNLYEQEARELADFALTARFFNVGSTTEYLDCVYALTRSDVERARTRLAATAMIQCVIMSATMPATEVRTFDLTPEVRAFVLEHAADKSGPRSFQVLLCDARRGNTVSLFLSGAGLSMETACRIAAGIESNRPSGS